MAKSRLLLFSLFFLRPRQRGRFRRDRLFPGSGWCARGHKEQGKKKSKRVFVMMIECLHGVIKRGYWNMFSQPMNRL
jgi:hypothetical protein